jgi:hypothetical protein
MCDIGTWFCTPSATTKLLGTNAIVLDSSTTSAASAGGNSLITHSTTAKGIREEKTSKINQSTIEWKP